MPFPFSAFAAHGAAPAIPHPDPYLGSVLALLQFEDDLKDGIAEFTWTAENSAALSATEAKFGAKSLSLNGTNQAVKYIIYNVYKLYDQDFTLEGWFYPTSVTGTRCLIEYGAAGTLKLVLDGSTLRYSDNGNTTGYALWDDGPTLSINTWYHVAITRSGSTLRGFLDGVEWGNQTTAVNDNEEDKFIGRDWGSTEFFAGYVDSIRVTKGVARYTTNFTPPTEAFPDFSTTYATTALLHFDGADASTTINDEVSANDAVWTVQLDPELDDTQAKFGSTSLYVNGNAHNWIKLAEVSNICFKSDDFTIECWFYLETGGAVRTVLDWQLGNVYVSVSATEVISYTDSAVGTLTGPTISTGQWYHLAIARDSGTVRCFLDGVKWDEGVGTFNNSGRSAVIGAYSTGTSQNWKGWIDELRATRGLARYTANFTAPTAAFEMEN